MPSHLELSECIMMVVLLFLYCELRTTTSDRLLPP